MLIASKWTTASFELLSIAVLAGAKTGRRSGLISFPRGEGLNTVGGVKGYGHHCFPLLHTSYSRRQIRIAASPLVSVWTQGGRLAILFHLPALASTDMSDSNKNDVLIYGTAGPRYKKRCPYP